MKVEVVLLALFISASFVGWPIIGSYSGMSGSWISLIVCVATTVAVSAMSFRQLSSVPGINAGVLLLVAGFINGVAVYLYSEKLADKSVPTAVFVVTVSILMAVIAPLLNWILNSAVPSSQQFLGYGLAVLAIYFLSR